MVESAAGTAELQRAPTITDRIDHLNIISRDYECSCPHKALEAAEEALLLSKQTGYEKGLAESLLSLGMIQRRLSEYQKSSVRIFEALPIFQKIGDRFGEATALKLAGLNYYYCARFDQALDFFNRSMAISLEIGSRKLTACLYNNIGELYREMGKNTEALDFYFRGLKLASRSKDIHLKAVALINIGQISFENGDWDGALNKYRKSVKIFQNVKDRINEGVAYGKMGEVYHSLGQGKKAADYCLRGLEITKEQGSRFYQIDILVIIGAIMADKGEDAEAVKYFKEALDIAEAVSAKRKIYMIHAKLSYLYEKMADFQMALYHYRLHHKIENDVSVEELERQLYMTRAQFKIDQAEKEAEIFRLRNIEIRQKAEEIQKKAAELEESYRNIKAISETGQKITSTFNFNNIVNTVYKSLNTLMDASSFGIVLYKENEDTIEYKYIIDNGVKQASRTLPLQEKTNLAAWCILKRSEIYMNDFETEHTAYIDPIADSGSSTEPQSVMFYPLIVGNDVIGAITAQSFKKNAYTLHNLNMFKALASYIAIALNNWQKSQEIRQKASELESVNSRLSVEINRRKTAQKSLEKANRKLENLLTLDVLTGAFNRRGFDKFLKLEWRRSVREKVPISMVLIDIDYFKEYNDKHGHLAGDTCLQKVAAALLTTIKRPMDLIARYGGEEFIVILPHTDFEGAVTMAEIMRDKIESLEIPHGKSIASPYLTISLGTSTVVPTRRNSQREFIHSADQALYRAKQEGRNRVCSSLIG